MSYQVLARKWRPRRFAEMVGQEHVVRALSNALATERLHHAYLFTGTRGVGKTTVARILAKALNCEAGLKAEPCGECASCREVDEGRFVDLIEVDAASRAKVDETRELMDNVQYAPARGRFKVYLIDEVHMFSKHAFNALLKTLEEPPPHVKFLLATTDPQKLPVTVLSRCLQFHLRSLPEAQIAAHLAELARAESIEAEPAALATIGHAARGSLRDALSLLDQAIAFGAGAVRDVDVRDMLGVTDQDAIWRLLEALGEGDGQALLAGVERMASGAPDFDAVLADLLGALQRIAVAQVVPEAPLPEGVDAPRVAELAARLTPEDVQLYYQIGVLGRRDMPYAISPRSGLEMVLLRMLAFTPELPGAPPRPGPGPGSASASTPASGHAGTDTAGPARPPAKTRAEPPVGAPVPGEPAGKTHGSGRRRGTANTAVATDRAAGVAQAGGAPAAQAAVSAPATPVPVTPVPATPGPVTSGTAGAGPRTRRPGPTDAGTAVPSDALRPASAAAQAAAPGPASSIFGQTDAQPEPDSVASARSAMPSDAPPDLPGSAGVDGVGEAASGTPLARRAPGSPAPSSAATPAAQVGGTAPAFDLASPGEPDPSGAAPEAGEGIAAAPAVAVPGEPLTPAGWSRALDALALSGLARELASNAELLSHEGGRVRLRIAPSHAQLRRARAETAIRVALSSYLGEPVELALEVGERTGETPAEARVRLASERQAAAAETMRADPGVAAICDMFGATVDPSAVTPTDPNPT